MTAKPAFTGRIAVFMFLAVLVLLILIGRLFWVQIVWGEELRLKAAGYRFKTLLLNPVRGNIYDRNHNELVTNMPAFSVYARPNKITGPEKLARQIAPLLNLKAEEVYSKVSEDKPFVWLKRKINPQEAEAIKNLHLAEIGLVEESKRSYNQGAMAAHVLGFVGDDNQGITGVEKSYEQELRGAPGYLHMESDAAGQPIPQSPVNICPSLPGNNLILTIDQTIQYYVEKELDKIMSEHQPSMASIIVMDPQTGEILSLGNRPSFNPEDWQQVDQSVWEKNAATLYNYEPGSTLKMFLAAAALEEKVVQASEWFYDPGYIVVKGHRIYCWDRKGHKEQTFAKAVENSCNPVFIQVGLRLCKERFFKYLRQFGFGHSTGVDLPGEETGIIKPIDQTSELDLASMCIGQSISVTPMQLINGLCAVANGGNLIKPYLVKEIQDNNGRTIKETKPQVIRRAISSGAASELTQMLEKVVLEGTGQKARVEGYRIAGKTGTAQVPGPNGYVKGSYVASFAGFAPVEKPRIAVLVMVVEPKGAYYGSEVAAPAFQELIQSILNYLGLPEEEGLRDKEQKIKESGSPGSMVVVPDVIGFPASDAYWFIENRGLKPNLLSRQGIIKEQKPAGGSLVSRGCPVSLRTYPEEAAKNSLELTMPDLTGLSVKKAGEICEALELQPLIKGSGLAVKQDPPPGATIKKKSIVSIYFAQN